MPQLFLKYTINFFFSKLLFSLKIKFLYIPKKIIEDIVKKKKTNIRSMRQAG